MSGPLMEKKFLSTSMGRIAYLEAGTEARPPLLLVHGIPTSSYLWRHVMRFLQNDFHCYAPDLMGLGDTEVDPETGRFDMEAQSEMLAEFMAALGHERFNVVCHDQGGAAVQILAARRPEHFIRLVLTNCVCYDNWPVPVIARLQTLARIPYLTGALTSRGFFEWFETRTPLSSFRRGVYQKDSMSDESIREYLRPLRTGEVARKRFLQFLLAGNPRSTLQAVAGLKEFHKPTLVLWGADDPYISPSWGKKLQEDIPGARRLELIPFCGHFWPEDRPSEFASLIGEFLSEGSRAAKPAKRVAPKIVKTSKRAATKAAATSKRAVTKAAATSKRAVTRATEAPEKKTTG